VLDFNNSFPFYLTTVTEYSGPYIILLIPSFMYPFPAGLMSNVL
jgi:hypothetical protein